MASKIIHLLPDLHTPPVHDDGMRVHQGRLQTEAAERLRRARSEAGYASPTDAAKRFHWTLSTYYAHENGSRGFSKHTAIDYAKAFGVSPLWLISGEGSPTLDNKIKVEGYIGAGSVIYALELPTDYGIDEVEVPFGSAEDFIAFIVHGDSNYPAYQNNEIVICRRAGQPPNRLLNRECAVTLSDDTRMLKTISSSSVKNRFTLLSFNHPPILNVEIVWASPIEWVRKP